MKQTDDYKLAALIAGVFKAIGHPTRLLIVELLADGEKCVCEINQAFEADHSTISKHLSVLKNAGVVSDRKQGLNVYYKLEMPCIISMLKCLMKDIGRRSERESKLFRRAAK